MGWGAKHKARQGGAKDTDAIFGGEASTIAGSAVLELGTRGFVEHGPDLDAAAARGAGSDADSRPSARAKLTSTPCMRASLALLILTYMGGLALGGVVLYNLFTGDAKAPEYAWSIAGIFVGLSLPLSFHDIHLHTQFYVTPLQRHYLRILWMVPIYAIQSWLALRFKDSKVYLQVARECYESYVLQAFFKLMLEFLGGKKRLALKLRVRAVTQGRERVKHLPPCSWFCRKGWSLGSRFVHRCTVGVYQYVLLRVLCSIAVLIAEAAHSFHEEWSDPVYAITSVVINVSQMHALYILALFYVELRKDLGPLSPLGKFAVVKAVVFVSWWQGIAITAAGSLGLIPSGAAVGYSDEDVAKGLQDFAICIEMFFAALAHSLYYSYRDVLPSPDGSPSPIIQLQQQDAQFDKEQAAAQAAAHAEALAARQAMLQKAQPGGVVPAGLGSAMRADEEALAEATAAQLVRAASTKDVLAAPAAGAAASSSASSVVSAGKAGSSNGGRTKFAGADGDGDDLEDWDRDVDVSELQVHMKPLGVKAAMIDMLPGDVMAETAENLRTGFGLTHKWEKRKKQRRAALHDWANQQWEQAVRTGGSEPGSAGSGTAAAAAATAAAAGSVAAPPPTPASAPHPHAAHATPATLPRTQSARGGFVPPPPASPAQGGPAAAAAVALSARTAKRSERVTALAGGGAAGEAGGAGAGGR